MQMYKYLLVTNWEMKVNPLKKCYTIDENKTMFVY